MSTKKRPRRNRRGLWWCICASRYAAGEKCDAMWRIVMLRNGIRVRSRRLRREISAKMDARMASRIIMMELFSEHAEAAQETCADEDILRFIMVAFVIVCRFLSLRWRKLTTENAILQEEILTRKKHWSISQTLAVQRKKDWQKRRKNGRPV